VHSTLSRGVANPVAAVLSSGMMLQWLSERYGGAGLREASTLLQDATRKLLEEGKALTPDIGGSSSTSQVTEELIHNVKLLAKT
jgi:3-isopropylmalate dehydrogenase